jgi:hypothetical protein
MDGHQWLAGYRERLTAVAARADAARRAVGAVEATATSRDGAVTATVDRTGRLRRLVLDERAEQLTRPQLAALVVETAGRAADAAAAQVAEVVAPLVGEHGLPEATA